MSPSDKPLVWLSGEVKTPPFSAEARLEAGFLLRRLQKGEKLALPASRPLPIIGAGCHELRIKDKDVEHRIVYAVAEDAIVILEVFGKKGRTLPTGVLKNCQRRLSRYEKDVEETDE
jgi:phage-related protein